MFGIGVAQGGAAIILAFVVILIMMGRLVPRRTLDDVRADRDRRILELAAERDTWRSAHEVSEEARRGAQDQLREMLELSRTSVAALQSLPHVERRQDVPLDSPPLS